MKKETFKFLYFLFLFVLILLFFTKDINLSKLFYKKINNIEDPKSITILVNKNNKLNSSYVPKLEKLNTTYANDLKYLTKEAKEAFEKLFKDASKKQLSIKIVSAYRSYNYQETLFNKYKKEYGLKYALKCSSKAGFSEHQTGLAIDVMGPNKDYNQFEKTKEFKWMLNNSYKYGFILRYPKDKENITGYKYEPWHYRYVGVPLATYLHNKNKTLEEYYS